MEWHERLADIEGFLHYARSEWPRVRATFADLLPLRCQRCLLSEKCVPVTDGLCPACREPSSAPDPARPRPDFAALQAQLDDLLRQSQGAGPGQYDALVLYSGGKDSTYLLHRLSGDYPRLRLLALTVDNGFASEAVLANARRAFRTFDVDHSLCRPRQSLFAKTFRHALLHRKPDEPYPLVDRLDGELTFDIGRTLAAELAIPLVLIGLSGEQVEGILGLHTFASPAAWEAEKNTPAEFGLEGLYTPEEKRFWWHASAWPAARRPRVLYPFYAWQLSEQFLRAEVVRLGLIATGSEHPLVTNSHLVPVLLAVDNVVRGYAGFEPGFAHLVREGKADRTEWLAFFEAVHALAHTGQFLPRCVDETLGCLQLTRKDLGLPGG